jgi:predicted kinase
VSRPLLVIVSGPPGAGKTTVARRLGPALGLPVVAKDDIKESLFGSLGWSDREWSRKLGAATWRLLFLVLERLMEAGTSALIESNFDRRLHVGQFRDLSDRFGFDVVEVYCTANVETLARRYRERELSGDRHPGHEGSDYSPDDESFAVELTQREHVPLGVALLTFEVDTTDPERVDLDEIVGAVREGLHGT